jgi:hypothetical protein
VQAWQCACTLPESSTSVRSIPHMSLASMPVKATRHTPSQLYLGAPSDLVLDHSWLVLKPGVKGLSSQHAASVKWTRSHKNRIPVCVHRYAHLAVAHVAFFMSQPVQLIK